MQVLETGQVAPDDDEVHPPRVRDVVRPEREAAPVDDLERELLPLAGREACLRRDEPEAVRGDREAVGPLRRRPDRFLVPGVGLPTLERPDYGSKRGRAGEDEREDEAERGQPEDGVHSTS